MRIVDLREEWVEDTKRASATVIWERRQRTDQEIYIGVSGQLSDGLDAVPNAFLTGAVLPAMYNFERQIFVDGPLCPRLVENLERAMRLVSDWYRDAPPIEVRGDISSTPFEPSPAGKSGLMLSGGVDSLASLRMNRDTYNEDDPEWFEYGLVVESGFDAFDTSPSGAYWPELELIASDVSLQLVPVSTNLRELEPADHFFNRYLHGALLATFGHSLPSALSRLAIASADPDPSFHWGSHPHLDPLLSSGALDVTHDLPATSRYHKTALIADWPVVHSRLKVCYVADRLPPGKWNCSECEKCLRTMLTLAALRKLQEFEVFDSLSLDAATVAETLSIGPAAMAYYEPIAAGLDASGQTDLADIVRAKVDEQDRELSVRWSEHLKEFDRKIFGGLFRRIKRRVDWLRRPTATFTQQPRQP